MSMDFFYKALEVWLSLLVFPFSHLDLLWRMIPIYVNALISGIYSRKLDSGAAIFGGFTALWAGADWIRGYMTDNPHSFLAWIISLCFCVYGLMSLYVGFFKRRRYYKIFSRKSLLTFFAISFYPIQAGYIYNLDGKTLASIFIVAIPIILIFELVTFIVRILIRAKD